MTALPSEPFGQLPDGRAATLFTLENDRLRVRITDFGGRMVSIEAPDRDGHRDHVLLGFADVAAYADYGGSFGCLLGRYANRIAGAAFTLDGHTFPLSKNSGDLTLHGGALGFNRVFWTVASATDATLVLTHVSPDGDQGFPGEVTVQATYRLDADSLSLTLEARTTKPTVINLSAHPYFNLGGPTRGDVLGHEVTIAAKAFLPTDAAQLPFGEIRPVAGTPFDFRTPALLGARIRQPDPQLYHGLGYDHCFVLGTDGPAIRVHDPVSGRVLEIHTDQPGIQVYTGNKLTGTFAGHGGVVYRQSAGLALEPQDFPDAPHHGNFPSTTLRPGEVYRRMIRYRFGTA
ncbi:aldose epimerase family protein [Acidisphaera sp. S103]|uniref:aldose epimerase family protein n=1 Tax=Acidisphaera sp. S103 TaxID=1747223 RepID=UPI001C2095B2|nr:aldose epimerase family protein [Acidisphaera sp. S103]